MKVGLICRLGTGPDSLRITQIGFGWKRERNLGPSRLWRVFITVALLDG